MVTVIQEEGMTKDTKTTILGGDVPALPSAESVLADYFSIYYNNSIFLVFCLLKAEQFVF